MAATDVLVFAALFVLALSGALSGFFRSLVIPAALLGSMAAGSITFSMTQNMLWAMVGSSTTFLIIRLGMAWIINQPVEDANKPMSPLNRIAGCLINLTWGGAFALAFVAVLALCPFDRFGLGDITKDVTRSKTYALLLPLVIVQGGTPEKPAPCAADVCSKSPDEQQQILDDPALQEILADPRIQAIMNSPELQKAIETKNMQALLSHPTVAELQRDPAFLFKIFRAYSTIQSKTQTPSN